MDWAVPSLKMLSYLWTELYRLSKMLNFILMNEQLYFYFNLTNATLAGR